jgi:hypothetical protein
MEGSFECCAKWGTLVDKSILNALILQYHRQESRQLCFIPWRLFDKVELPLTQHFRAGTAEVFDTSLSGC